jgi:hypothetical protein
MGKGTAGQPVARLLGAGGRAGSGSRVRIIGPRDLVVGGLRRRGSIGPPSRGRVDGGKGPFVLPIREAGPFCRARGGAMERPAVSTPEEIASALTKRNLGQWADMAKAVPQRAAEALAEAAEKFTPKVKHIKMPAPGVLTDLAALDAWIAELRAALATGLAEGPVLPRL